MTDRISYLTVVLDKEYRDDDVECIVNAIQMVKGVADVGLNVANPSDYTARTLVRLDLTKKIWDALK